MDLLTQLQAMGTDLDLIGSIMIEQGFPTARATLSFAAGRGATAHFDTEQDANGNIVSTPRPLGPRKLELEPPIKTEMWTRPDDVMLSIPADVWPQVLEVVHSKILGTADAQEHTREDGSKFWVISGRGKPRSAERMDWIRKCAK